MSSAFLEFSKLVDQFDLNIYARTRFRNRLDKLAVVDLKALISKIDLPPDGRLPPERELAERLGISRAELRKSLAMLEAEGVLWRHVGKGTFLAKHSRNTDKPDVASIAHRTSPPEAMQVRMILEPEVAGLASRVATGAQIAELKALCIEMRRATSWPDYQQLDVRFHTTLAQAAGNSLLAELHGIVNEVRRSVVWGGLAKRTLGPPKDYHSFAEHEAIVSAIEVRDRVGAMDAMRTHLNATSTDLMGDPTS
jgi:DNA-binding FadR family transcriptional regulator